MKNQYFGDVRDLFKYDLIQWILKEISSLQFTFIPMLTENDPKRGDGGKRDFDRAKKGGRPGTHNKELMEFLKKYGDKRDFTEIENYFKPNGFEIVIYKGHEYFDKRMRNKYFEKILEEYLRKSLVFVDPDNGLQIKNSKEKHLLYSEVKALYNRMDDDSILMIFQYFPRARYKYKEYSPEGRANKLEEETGDLPIYISDNEIIFFLLTKNEELKSQLEGVIERYKKDYPNRLR